MKRVETAGVSLAAPLPITQWHAIEPPHSVENPDAAIPIRILRVELKS